MLLKLPDRKGQWNLHSFSLAQFKSQLVDMGVSFPNSPRKVVAKADCREVGMTWGWAASPAFCSHAASSPGTLPFSESPLQALLLLEARIISPTSTVDFCLLSTEPDDQGTHKLENLVSILGLLRECWLCGFNRLTNKKWQLHIQKRGWVWVNWDSGSADSPGSDASTLHELLDLRWLWQGRSRYQGRLFTFIRATFREKHAWETSSTEQL